jgi:hypothetical protein
MRVFEAAGSGLFANELVNNAIGVMAITFNDGVSVTAGVRNHGLGFQATSAAGGIHGISWPTSTAIQQGRTVTFGEFGTDTNRPPVVLVFGGSTATGSHAFGFCNAVNTAGATLQLLMMTHATGAVAAMSAGSATAALPATIVVIPAVQSRLSNQNYTFNTVTASAALT